MSLSFEKNVSKGNVALLKCRLLFLHTVTAIELTSESDIQIDSLRGNGWILLATHKIILITTIKRKHSINIQLANANGGPPSLRLLSYYSVATVECLAAQLRQAVSRADKNKQSRQAKGSENVLQTLALVSLYHLIDQNFL